MRLAVCTIQMNRGRWLREWFSFHYLMGVRKFYFFAHRCTDDTHAQILQLQQVFDITAFVMPEDVDRPQLVAYRHVYTHFDHEFDWIAYLDGDEFLFSPSNPDLRETLEGFSYYKISGVCAYWACYGSSGHIEEPDGLVISNYKWRHRLDAPVNRHVKSIVMGRQGQYFDVAGNAHIFKTRHGLIDENGRSITQGLTEYEPTHARLRINHYVVQSRSYFLNQKKRSGAPDAGRDLVRPDSWWDDNDKNEVLDESLLHVEPVLAQALSGQTIDKDALALPLRT